MLHNVTFLCLISVDSLPYIGPQWSIFEGQQEKDASGYLPGITKVVVVHLYTYFITVTLYEWGRNHRS